MVLLRVVKRENNERYENGEKDCIFDTITAQSRLDNKSRF